jgi:hypothetical protein
MSNQDWIRPEDLMPTKGDKVTWISPSGHEVSGEFVGVWLTDSGLRVYYHPTFWKPASA